jgi:hypothetical protein
MFVVLELPAGSKFRMREGAASLFEALSQWMEKQRGSHADLGLTVHELSPAMFEEWKKRAQEIARMELKPV